MRKEGGRNRQFCCDHIFENMLHSAVLFNLFNPSLPYLHYCFFLPPLSRLHCRLLHVGVGSSKYLLATHLLHQVHDLCSQSVEVWPCPMEGVAQLSVEWAE